MQPTWRGGELLVKIMPTDANWEPIFYGGTNGLFMAIIALSWWIHTMELNGQKDLKFLVAIDDVKWVLSKLSAELTAKKKHPQDETIQDKLVSKR